MKWSIQYLPSNDEFFWAGDQRLADDVLSLDDGSGADASVVLLWLDNGSKSWVRPHEKTNDDNEWKWVRMTMACTTSDNDQKFGALVNFCAGDKRKWKKKKQKSTDS